MKTVSEFIDKLGGSTTVADCLELPQTTVASWKTRNSIPVHRFDRLIKIAREKGLECDHAMLVGLQVPTAPDDAPAREPAKAPS